MMKRLLLIALAVVASMAAVSAKDIIVLRNSERIDAKIVQVTPDEVSYKKADYEDGPTFVLKISEISSIIYSNGDVQAFTVENTDTKNERKHVMDEPSDVGFKFNPEPQGDKRTFGISIGYTSKQIKYSDGKYPWCYIGEDESKKSSPALQVGFYWAPEFRYGVGLQTGLYYELSTSKYSGEGYSASVSEHNLSVPVRLQYRYEIIRDLSIFLYTGPSLDVSVAMKGKASYMGESEEINMYAEEGAPGRFNMLWGVGAGIRWKGLQLMLGGDWGMLNLYKDEASKLSKPFHISLTYLF